MIDWKKFVVCCIKLKNIIKMNTMIAMPATVAIVETSVWKIVYS